MKHLYIRHFPWNIFIVLSICLQMCTVNANMVICTAANSSYFKPVLNLIGSIHRVDFDRLNRIVVYDIGLSHEERASLSDMAKVELAHVELTHPDLLKPMVTRNEGKTVPGWYAWKPVIIKQTLDRFDTVLYMDAGNTVMRSLEELFEHIAYNGYFLVSVFHDLNNCTTRFVRTQFGLDTPERQHILNTISLSANIIGCTKAVYEKLILPMYEMTKDIRYFEDDGSAGWGFGGARHDQALWSICARLLGLHVYRPGWLQLKLKDRTVPFHTNIYWPNADGRVDSYWLNHSTAIYQSRLDYDLKEGAQWLGLAAGQYGVPYFKNNIQYSSTPLSMGPQKNQE